VRDRALGERHGAAGRERALGEFDPRRIWSLVEDEYRRVLRPAAVRAA
jgi:hypothetical protein